MFIETACDTGKKVVVVLQNGSAIIRKMERNGVCGG